MQILDYSRGYPSAQKILAAGYAGVIRYLSRELAPGQTTGVLPITPAELADMKSAGLAVALVHQHADRSRALKGYEAGRHDGAWALARANELPNVKVQIIYFAVDFDTNPTQWPVIGEYFRGLADSIGAALVGTYAEYDLLEYLSSRNLIRLGWQPYAWSRGHNQDGESRHSSAALFQRLQQVTVDGVNCDVNDILKADFGQLAYLNGDILATSYNGWSAGSGWSVAGGQLAPLVVAGEAFAPGVRAGDVHTVLEYVANQLHLRVEPVVHADWHQADDWGYNYRVNTNNPSQLSCHASGTAIDYNATRHPNGKGGTWTADQKAEILRILAEVDNTVRCLFGYDEMHFEISGNASQVAAVAAKLRAGTPAPSPAPVGRPTVKRGSTGPNVALVQRYLGVKPADGIFGEITERAVVAYQTSQRLAADGIVGPATWARIASGLAVPSPSVPVPAPTPRRSRPEIRRGSTGEHVKFFQRWMGLVADGVFGPKTEAKAKSYQSSKDLVPDGVVGNKTWGAMGALYY